MQKRGALELSIGTIVVLVLGMSMLILGLTLVRSIFSGATSSVDELNEKVQGEISALFSDGHDVVVKLGPDHKAKIKPDSTLGIGLGAQTPDGTTSSFQRLSYVLELDETASSNCVKKLGKANTEALFKTPLNKPNQFDRFEGPNSFAIIEVNVPKGTQVCSQKVRVTVKDTTSNQETGGDFFIVEILKPGIF